MNLKKSTDIKKSSIISVSRRTDIPAYYSKWFMDKIKKGLAGYINPFNNQKYLVSLKPEDVKYFVFWSNNYIPFMKTLSFLKEAGYKFYFNYTINNYPAFFEPDVPETKELIGNLKVLSELYTPESINWRYDPIIISNRTGFDQHLKNFEFMTKSLEGYVKRCYFSFVSDYKKVTHRFEDLKKTAGIIVSRPADREKIDFSKKLTEIASASGITMNSCCSLLPVSGAVKKASCIDRDVLKLLFNESGPFKDKPSRDGCGCIESIDIGAYDTCGSNCLYCYANSKETKINKNRLNHNPDSLFLNC